MERVECLVSFRRELLRNADLCFSVALALTHDPIDARKLASEVLLWAWGLRTTENATHNLKSKLLTKLRNTYLARYAVRTQSPRVRGEAMRTNEETKYRYERPLHT